MRKNLLSLLVFKFGLPYERKSTFGEHKQRHSLNAGNSRTNTTGVTASTVAKLVRAKGKTNRFG